MKMCATNKMDDPVEQTEPVERAEPVEQAESVEQTESVVDEPEPLVNEALVNEALVNEPTAPPQKRPRGRPKKKVVTQPIATEVDHNFWTGMLQTHRDMLTERRANHFASFALT